MEKRGSVPIGHIPMMLAEDLTILGPDTSVVDAAKALASNRVGMIVIAEDSGRVIGVLSKSDIVRVVADWPSRITDLSIKHLMSREPVTCTDMDDAFVVVELMRKLDVQHLPVIESGCLKGLVSYENVRNYLADGADEQKPTGPSDRPPETGGNSRDVGGNWPEGNNSVKSFFHSSDFDETADEADALIPDLVDHVPDPSFPGGKRPIPSFATAIFLFVVVGLAAFTLSQCEISDATISRFLRQEGDIGSGLALKTSLARREFVDGEEVLVVRGRIENITDREVSVPSVKVELYSHDNEITESAIVVPKRGTLAAHEFTEFRAEVHKPSSSARRVEVTFTSEKTPAVGAN